MCCVCDDFGEMLYKHKKDRGEIIRHSISGLIFTGVNMTSHLRKALECGASVNLTMGILECPRNHKGIWPVLHLTYAPCFK